MKPILLAVALTLLAAAADAMCIKCDQSTGYRCYMSINGTKTHCDSPSDAGCFMWGVCTGASDCDHGCILNPSSTAPLRLASVTITSPALGTAKSSAPQHLKA